MPFPEMLPDSLNEDICGFAARWGLDMRTVMKLTALQEETEFDLTILSGARTAEEQEELRREGRPTAPDKVSTHLSCPATGVDLYPSSVAITNAVKARLGAEGVRAGLRWGGGSRVDSETGIPLDWNHFDLGPRA